MKKSKSNPYKFFFTLVILSTLLSACGFKDIDKNVFVAAIGIDTSDNQEKPFKVTLKLYVPTSSFKQAPEPEYAYISMEGETISDAIRLLTSKVDKKLEFGHSKMIVFGEELIEGQQMETVLDFLLRRPDIQMISWMAVGRPTADEILKMVPKTETAAYPALYNYFDHNGTESPYVVTTYLFDLRRRMLEGGIDPILPIIEVEEEQFKINKSIVLSENGKPLELNSLETKIYNVIKKDLINVDLMVKENNEHFLALIDGFKVNYKTEIQDNGAATLKLDLTLNGIIAESKKSMSVKKLPDYSKMAEQDSTKRTISFMKKLKEAGADPIGYGVNYKTKQLHNQKMSYEEWKEVYKNAELDVSIKVGLKSTGSIQ